jgi:hypothetical protein
VIAIVLFAVALTLYLHDYRYRFWAAGGDTTPAELLPLALMRNHDLVFDGLGNPNFYWFAQRRGHVISAYPILPGFFNVPVYAIANARGVPLDQEHRSMLSMISASIVTALSVLFFFLAVSRIVARPSTAIGATIVYAFGTTAGSVAARGMWQHGPSLLLLTMGLWLITRGDRVSLSLAALPLGFAVVNRPLNILIVLPLATYVLWRDRRAFAWFSALALVPATFLAWYSLRYWGSLTSLGQYPALHRFNAPFWQGLAGLLFSPARGLFIFTPLFVFAIAAIPRRPSRDPLLFALATGAITTVLAYAKWDMWWGGSCFGYRLLTECIPALTILLAVGWERMFSKSIAARIAIGVFAAATFYIHFLGAFYYPCGFDTVPNEINAHPERLWDFRETEVRRCSARLFERVESHLHRR